KEVIELYLKVIEDLLKADDKSRIISLKSLQDQIVKARESLQSLVDKFVDDLIDQSTFNITKSRYENQIASLESKKLELEKLDTSFMRYLSFGSMLLKDLPRYYQE